MMLEEKACLLFCDTFVHENEGDIQLDLVGFQRSVAITEIRVIPSGCKVHPEINDRLGDTNPSQFSLELFVKNLNQPSASVFERLGTLEYEEGKSIQLIIQAALQVPTNVVLLRGWYQKLTVCIYGNFASVQLDQSQVPPPPPMDGSVPMDVQIAQPLQAIPPQIPAPMLQSQITQITPTIIPLQQTLVSGQIPSQGLDGQVIQPQSLPAHPDGAINAFPQNAGELGYSPREDVDRRERERERERFNEFQRGDRRDEDRDDRNRGRRDRFDDDRRSDYYDRNRDNQHSYDRYRDRDRYGSRRRDDDRDGRNRNDDSQRFNSHPNEVNNVGIPTQTQRPDVERVSSANPITKLKAEDLFEPLSPESEFSDIDNNVGGEGEKPNQKDTSTTYEDIESDEDLMLDDFDFEDNGNDIQQNIQDMFESGNAWASISLSFNPYQCVLSKVPSIPSLTETSFEATVRNFKNRIANGEVLEPPPHVKQIQDHIVSDIEGERDAKWVTMLEQLPSLLPTALAYLRSQPYQRVKEQHFVSIIADWACYSMNVEKARALPLAVNIRLLKAGINVASLLSNSCAEYEKLLVENGVHGKLLQLLKTEHMASSMKLLILKTIDATTNSGYGMESFMGWNNNAQGDSDDTKLCVYEELIQYLVSEPTVRVVASIQALLQKAHFYHSLASFQDLSAKYSNERSFQTTQKTSLSNGVTHDVESKAKKTDETPAPETPTTPDEQLADVSDKDLKEILMALEAIYNVLKHRKTLISQPHLNSFPTKAQLDRHPLPDCTATVIRLLESRCFLESLTLISASQMFCEPPVYSIIRDIVFYLLDSDHGLRFLLSDAKSTNALVKVLTQYPEPEIVSASLQQYLLSDELAENCHPHHLGLLIVYHLQTLQCVGELMKTAKQGLSLMDMDSAENIDMLHLMYSMTFSPIGRDAVISVLSHGNNLTCLLPFLTGDEDHESKMKKSVSSRYASVLLNLTLQYLRQVSMLTEFGPRLLTIPKKENDKTIEDIQHWLAPLEKLSQFSIESIPPLIEFTKGELEDFKIGTGIPKGVLTALRLIKHLTVNPKKDSGEQKDLRWNLAIIQLFSCNAFELFVQLLNNLNEQLLAPWKQHEPLSSQQCLVLIQSVSILLEVFDEMLSHLLATNSYQLKDARLLQGLFQTHTILCSKPGQGPMFTKIQEDIINILIKFMNSTKKAPESEEAVKSGTWYILLKELLNFTVAKPQNFVTGFVLLAELLPIPLPLYTSHSLGEKDVTQIMNHRLMAMANFSCLSSELKLTLKTVIRSSCSSLQHYLRRVCYQLVDLGASVAFLIIKTLCGLIEEMIMEMFKDTSDDATPLEEKPETAKVDEKSDETKKEAKPDLMNSGLMYASTLLASMVSQPSGKAVFLHVVTSTSESSAEYPELISKLLSVYKRESHVQYLDAVLLPILEAVCDHEICFGDFENVVTLQHIANNVVNREILTEITAFLFTVVNQDLALQLVTRGISILESLTDHNYGMQVLKSHLIQTTAAIAALLERLVDTVFTKEEREVYAAISTFIEFIQLLNSPGPENYSKNDIEEGVASDKLLREGTADEPMTQDENPSTPVEEISPIDKPQSRTLFVNGHVLKLALTSDAHAEHPLEKLEKIIESQCKDNESLSILGQAITTLRMTMIATGESKDLELEATKIALPDPEPAQNLFNKRLRTIYVNTMDADRAENNDWFEAPAPDELESDGEADTTKTDLLMIAEKFIPNFNLKEEIEKGYVDTSEAKKSKRSKRRTDMIFKKGDHIDDTKRLRFDVSALSTPHSARGIGRGANRGLTRNMPGRGFNNNRGFNRGFGRGYGRGRGRGQSGGDDHFRARRQNTSRPPSMHVDDFVNMEKEGQTMMANNQNQHQEPQENNERFQRQNYNNQNKWNNNGPRSGFRRSYGGSSGGNQGQRDDNNGDWNNRSFGQYGGGNRFHSRSNSDWNNQGNQNQGYRDSPKDRSQRGGYWAGPKQRDDNRFGGGGNYMGGGYRQGGRGRHQRTFTR